MIYQKTTSYRSLLNYGHDLPEIAVLTDVNAAEKITDECTIDMLRMHENVRILENELDHAKAIRNRLQDRFSIARLKYLELKTGHTFPIQEAEDHSKSEMFYAWSKNKFEEKNKIEGEENVGTKDESTT